MASSNAAVEGLAGSLGGVTALLATYPLMTIQTLQATRRSKEARDPSLTIPLKKQNGTFADIAEIISQSGWAGLYRGLRPSLLGTVFSQGIYFYLYSELKQRAIRILQQRGKARNGDIGVVGALIVAFLAGCGNVLITNPIWVVATRMQAHQKQAKDDERADAGPLVVAQEVYEESGIKGFWKGLLPSLIMVCNPTVNYMLYETFLTQIARSRRKHTEVGKKVQPASTLDVFLVSAAAKLGATIVTYPLQLIKARQMSAGKHTHADRQYKGTIHAILRIWKSEGFLGFYRGMHTKIVQSILAAALLMAIKEKMTRVALFLLKPKLPPANIVAVIAKP